MNASRDEILVLHDEAETQGLGAAIAAVLTGRGAAGSFSEPDAPRAIALRGPLGAGKTTLVRGFLRSLGFTGSVRSPTYTLVERYEVGALAIRHFDLYRLGDPEELEYLGERETFVAGTVWWVEWPSRGAGFLPPWSLEIEWLPVDGAEADPARREIRCSGELAAPVGAAFRALASGDPSRDTPES